MLNSASLSSSSSGGSAAAAAVFAIVKISRKWCMLVILTCAESCPVGSYEKESECISCPLGFYQDSDASVECRPCTDERNTTFIAARSLDECKRLSLSAYLKPTYLLAYLQTSAFFFIVCRDIARHGWTWDLETYRI